MKRILMIAIVMSLLLMLVPVSTTQAIDRSVTVWLLPDLFDGVIPRPHINTAVVQVYGPNGYYQWKLVQAGRSYVPGWFIPMSFFGAPTGNYLIKVFWSPGWDYRTNLLQTKSYTLSSKSLGLICKFNSP